MSILYALLLPLLLYPYTRIESEKTADLHLLVVVPNCPLAVVLGINNNSVILLFVNISKVATELFAEFN